jgi:hypothetical protein
MNRNCRDMFLMLLTMAGAAAVGGVILLVQKVAG